MGYSKAPKQPQSSARPMCHSHTMTNTGANQRPYALLHIGARCTKHYAMGDDTYICNIYTVSAESLLIAANVISLLPRLLCITIT